MGYQAEPKRNWDTEICFEQGNPFPKEEQNDQPQQQHRQDGEKGEQLPDDDLPEVSRQGLFFVFHALPSCQIRIV